MATRGTTVGDAGRRGPEPGFLGPAPLVVTADGGRAADLARRYRAEGWRVLPGWRPALVAGWNLVPERVICTGEVAGRDDAADAVVMAARGAGVIALARCDRTVLALLVDDLRQLGEAGLDLADPAAGVRQDDLRQDDPGPPRPAEGAIRPGTDPAGDHDPAPPDHRPSHTIPPKR